MSSFCLNDQIKLVRYAIVIPMMTTLNSTQPNNLLQIVGWGFPDNIFLFRVETFIFI